MYVVAAEYYAKEGKEKEIIDILKKMIPLSRAEPGCKLYMVNQSPEDPRKLLLYEQYVDEDGYKAHQATDAFKENILGKVVPNLESRVRQFLRGRRTVMKPSCRLWRWCRGGGRGVRADAAAAGAAGAGPFRSCTGARTSGSAAAWAERHARSVPESDTSRGRRHQGELRRVRDAAGRGRQYRPGRC